jgi:RimK family alpha-L-glutamate ligase
MAIVTDEPGWHGAQLRAAFGARGYDSRFVSLRACGFALDQSGSGLQLPGFVTDLPAGVFVRGVPGGSLEQVVLYLDVLHALRELGVVVYNDARAIERSVDKAMTSFLLRRAAIATPPTWVTADNERFEALARRELARGHMLVTKPLFGSQGTGLKKIESIADLPSRDDFNGVFYLQRFIHNEHGNPHDWRVFVINRKAVAAMRRIGNSWISNVANGARCEAAMIDDLLRDIAEQAVNAIGMAYTGVDIMRDREGQTWVLEVNSIPAWKGLQSTCRFSIAELLVEDMIRLCRESTGLEEIA